MKRAVLKLLMVLGASALALPGGIVRAADDGIKAVYHINENTKANAALRNIRNHLDADPKAKIVVVTHSKGIDFLLEDAKAPNGAPFAATVAALKARGVDFRVCANTLKSRKISPDSVIPEASIVPSGVAEVARLQAVEKYVYVKP
ncbi:MAG: DsrE family protein [Burkholderiaceae bacterium]|nr:DsrE family protein [Burkholderiaceae bacterium]